jgi:hypothetical protein
LWASFGCNPMDERLRYSHMPPGGQGRRENQNSRRTDASKPSDREDLYQ